MRIRSFLFGLLALTLTVGLVGCDSGGSNGGGDNGDVTVTVDSLVEANSSFSTLNDALNAAGVTTLDDESKSFTVFAPTNDAFGALNTNALLGSDALGSVLQYHVIEGDSLGAAELSDGQTLTTLAGQDLTVDVDGNGNVSVEGSPVTDADITADNGIVHGIGDKPLLGNQPLTNILQFVSETQELVSAIASRGLTDGIGGSDVGTVFAPNNSAVTGNSETINNLSDQEIQQVLAYHTLGDKNSLTDLQDQLSNNNPLTVTTRQGEDLVIAQDGSGNVVFNDGQATLDTDNVNFEGTNNITHVIDGLLIPPSFGGASFEVVANASDLTPNGGTPDAHCLVTTSNGTTVFFNSAEGGIYAWDGSQLITHTSPANLNENIQGESNTINRCDAVALDGNGNAYFSFRSSDSNVNYVYRTAVSDATTFQVKEVNGINGLTVDGSTLYLAGVAQFGATRNGVFETPADLSGDTTAVAANPDVALGEATIDIASDGTLYGWSEGSGNFENVIVSLDPSASSPSFNNFADPYAGGTLTSGAGSLIRDLDVVESNGAEFITVYNNSFNAENGVEWGTIQLSDQSVSLLFTGSDLVGSLSVDGYTAGFTEAMAVNANGEIFVASRDDFGGENYIAKASNVLP